MILILTRFSFINVINVIDVIDVVDITNIRKKYIMTLDRKTELFNNSCSCSKKERQLIRIFNKIK